ncbi:hypothetical protein J2732_000789 [Achromobacter deleyi]|uniref:bestrophin-like domain n=1 Tax=Achromobacter TaxID=222 RepID=UPI000CFB72FB|nr:MULTISPECIES: hypothetical protein [Achromobacter]MDR6599806.1 hypothetical protein [Achromobacter deleyi]PQZ64430.1 hypothetical protein CQ050_20130 [Achromobacter sp. MYb9]
MNYSFVLAGSAVVFFFLLLGAIRFGRRIGLRGGGEDKGTAGSAAIEASVFALLGLLIAFTFSGAAQRMADRRNLLVTEVNAIGTAWLRIDLLNAPDQPALRDQFRRYVDERVNYYKHVADLDQRDAIAAKVGAIQNEIWKTSIAAGRNTVPPFAASYIASVNDMFDVSTAQTVAQKVHPPVVTYAFLGFLALVCACLIGLNLAGAKHDTVFHQIIYALVMTAALYIIVDFEFPRIGAIRIDQSDALLLSQRQAMGSAAAGAVK